MRRATEAIWRLPGVITPFPGGVARSGSKVGSRYKGLVASTSDAYCPTLRGRVESKLHPEANCAYEIVIDGIERSSRRRGDGRRPCAPPPARASSPSPPATTAASSASSTSTSASFCPRLRRRSSHKSRDRLVKTPTAFQISKLRKVSPRRCAATLGPESRWRESTPTGLHRCIAYDRTPLGYQFRKGGTFSTRSSASAGGDLISQNDPIGVKAGDGDGGCRKIWPQIVETIPARIAVNEKRPIAPRF